MHDMACGNQCEFPGCKGKCCFAMESCDDVHKCSKHSKENFVPERRATITISLTRPNRTVKVQVPLTATLEYDNMLNVARAADYLAQRALLGPF